MNARTAVRNLVFRNGLPRPSHAYPLRSSQHLLLSLGPGAVLCPALDFCGITAPSARTRRTFSNAICLKDHEGASLQHETLRSFKQSFALPQASHAIRDVSIEDVGKHVVFHGYLGSRRDLSKTISFSTLVDADQEHSIQVISNADPQKGTDAKHHASLKVQTSNSPVVLTGILQAKAKPKKAQASLQHGQPRLLHNEDVEVLLTGLQVLNAFPASITLQSDTSFPPEQRHLQLRQSHSLRHALSFRASAAQCCRRFLGDTSGFTEIETPLLFKSTPEGAREFLVPTRRKGFAYALPQSPQQYKQLLMASGIPRYFQFAKCFRDEDLRADRQPEFTQLDLEMAFATGHDVMSVIENLVVTLWSDLLNHKTTQLPLSRMSYHQAMSVYGSDKPDTRLGMEIASIGHMLPVDLIAKIGPLHNPIVEAMKLSLSGDPKTSRKFVGEFMDSVHAEPFVANTDGQPGIFIHDPRQPLGGLQAFGFEAAEYVEEALSLEEGDVVVLQARANAPFSGGSTALGRLRLALHKLASSLGYIDKAKGWSFLWINEFPLFTPTTEAEPGQGGSAGLSSTHHPFTAPASEADIDLLATSPLEARADHYDLVLNGVELGGGSRRIHDARMQEHILREVLKVGDQRIKDFQHLLDALATGCPPHAGFALGFDRLCAVMLGKESIRDVIAFPKSGSGEDLLVKSPSRLTEEQLQTYHLRISGTS